MIDLRERWLPDSLESGGRAYKLDTDFRTWIKFQDAYEREGIAIFDIFERKRPPLTDREWIRPALDFLASPNATPRATGESCERAFDFVLDGEYIVASFMAAYGINLTEVDYMHWHVFKALFNGLPEESKMAQIIEHRTWRKSSKRYETAKAEQREAWRLPDYGEERAMEEARKIAELMWNETNGGGE